MPGAAPFRVAQDCGGVRAAGLPAAVVALAGSPDWGRRTGMVPLTIVSQGGGSRQEACRAFPLVLMDGGRVASADKGEKLCLDCMDCFVRSVPTGF